MNYIPPGWREDTTMAAAVMRLGLPLWVVGLIVAANILPAVDAWGWRSHGQWLATSLAAAASILCLGVVRDRKPSPLFRAGLCVCVILLWWMIYLTLTGVPHNSRFI